MTDRKPRQPRQRRRPVPVPTAVFGVRLDGPTEIAIDELAAERETTFAVELRRIVKFGVEAMRAQGLMRPAPVASPAATAALVEAANPSAQSNG